MITEDEVLILLKYVRTKYEADQTDLYWYGVLMGFLIVLGDYDGIEELEKDKK